MEPSFKGCCTSALQELYSISRINAWTGTGNSVKQNLSRYSKCHYNDNGLSFLKHSPTCVTSLTSTRCAASTSFIK